MNRIFAALTLTLLAVAPVAVPAAAQSGGQAEADRRLAFVRSVSGDRSWLCAMVPIDRPDPTVNVGMTVSILPGGSAFAITTSTASLGGRTYSATYRLVGRASVLSGGRVSLLLDRSQMVRADALPNGNSWSDTSSVRLSFEVVPDTIASSRYRYMLTGIQSDDSGRAAINCVVRPD